MADLANSNIFLEHQRTPEQKLWKAVLSQGVYEACYKKAQALPLTFDEMRAALEQVDLENREYVQECVYAGYDTGSITRKAKEKVENEKER